MGALARPKGRRFRLFAALAVTATMIVAVTPVAAQAAAPQPVTWLTADDFTYGTYIIDRPGVYRLAEDISFNPNSPASLTAAVADGTIPGWLAGALEWPHPVDAYHAGMPLFTQLVPDGVEEFTPGGPMDARYDPAAFGVGFFAAIAITADDVVLDLNGHTIQQHPEHALLQRFFAVIELADQPFVPRQGPAGFGDAIDSATDVVIKNGTIGLSSHHGIHGNGNADITIRDVDFEGFEVAAVALNGVDGLRVENVTATNRKDIPVVGTFSSAQFIKAYVEHLVRTGSPTTLQVGGDELTPLEIRDALRETINNVHHDIVAAPNVVDGRAQIDASAHPIEYALYHNPSGLLDGNSYGFLLNNLGVAVNAFPTRPDGVARIPSRDVAFRNVRIVDQHASINEIPAIDAGGAAVIDPVGAVFQVWNLHPDTGAPITISSLDEAAAEYVGNPVANAQALVSEAKLSGEFDGTHLDVTRANMSRALLDWVEGMPGSETLADIGAGYFCNGDSMFHVNKGVIGFKVDGTEGVRLVDTSVDGLHNYGLGGTTLCGDYLDGFSHPLADLPGYGGAITRGYTFAGSSDVIVRRAKVHDLQSQWGTAVGFAVLTDSDDVRFLGAQAASLTAGWGGANPLGSPTAIQESIGFHVAPAATNVRVVRGCASGMAAPDGTYFVADYSSAAHVQASCRGVR